MKYLSVYAAMMATCASYAAAQDLPETKLNVVGSWGMVSMYTDYTKPFFETTIPDASGGKVTAEIKPFNELGLDGSEIIRLVSAGTLQFAETPMGYMIGDNAINGGNDLPGLAPDIETAKAISDAWLPTLEKLYADSYGVKVLGVYPYSAQVVYCNAPISGLADLKGKKIRASGAAIGDFVSALGGAPVSMSFGEVVQGLQKGVVDCAITGSMSGFGAKWHEVSTHIYELPIAWSPVVQVVGMDTWNGFDDSVQEFLTDQINQLSDDIWAGAASETAEGFACNTGGAACTKDAPGSMTLVAVSESDIALRDKVLRESVLSNWAAQCGADCVTAWNASVGQVAGINIE
ncbi:TRAP transporter substrate-binding protein [Shimia abyssi]|uniref:TRAP-type C4-dicarboxylate transport system substrate-binding protein n=1 Tax=Shimia abyssi TaxID=1662395 RepID=A0A2P8FB88_9RHOB|nr:TRAP transporter substrate-binding protein [Shimia abyssi]PSL18969.1 TRAP-type C4-dicarboxylate transport system substrate-binding protein [Shimia abyssi]